MHYHETTPFLLKVFPFASAVGLFWAYWLACGFDIPAITVGESMCQLPSQHKLAFTRFSFWQEDRVNSWESCIFLTSTAKLARSCLLTCFCSKHCFLGMLVPWQKKHYLWFTVHLYFQVFSLTHFFNRTGKNTPGNKYWHINNNLLNSAPLTLFSWSRGEVQASKISQFYSELQVCTVILSGAPSYFRTDVQASKVFKK